MDPSLKLTLRTRLFGVAAALALATMPITAIWLIPFSLLLLTASASAAACSRDLDERQQRLESGGSVALGLLVGPIVYLTLGTMITVI